MTGRTQTLDTDVVIVGSGFGGSMLAMVARQLGRRVVLIERGRHPRFAIGESSSPLAGILIEQLAHRYDLPRLTPLSSFGGWQRAYPHLTCGVKRGFTFFTHDSGRRYRARPDRSNQLLVAASPCDELADTHWLRADVDAWLVNEARALGADYLDETDVESVVEEDRGVVLYVRRGDVCYRVHGHGLVDASGPRGLGHRHFHVADRGFAGYPATAALFTHFAGVGRCDALADFRVAAGPRARDTPPYPLDDAAVHHVFEGGWMWVLRFGNGLTSAGVALAEPLARELRLDEGEAAWARLLARYPSLATLFATATPVRPFVYLPRLAYRAGAAVGRRWAALPSTAAFVDPLFSTGFPLTLLGIERLGRLLEQGLFSARHDSGMGKGLAAYERATLAEADQTAAYVGGCYAAFRDFEQFAAYSMFYFAAASFAEASRRLHPLDAPVRIAPSFLALNDRAFSGDLRRLSPAHVDGARQASSARAYEQAVGAAVEPLNVAGLCAPEKANWYGVDDADVVAGAAKLGVTPEIARAATRQQALRRGTVPESARRAPTQLAPDTGPAT